MDKQKTKKRKRKYTQGKPGDMTVHQHKYGFVEIENPIYYHNRLPFSPPQFLLRKATPEERREMIVNYIIRRSGREIGLQRLAEKLAVSKRTLQSDLRQLREAGVIEREFVFDKGGKQQRSRYRYTGGTEQRYGAGLTVAMLYDVKNRAGFRDWDWKEYSYRADGTWYSIEELEQAKSERRIKRCKYLQRVGASMSHGVRDANYLTLRYSHSIRGKEGEPTPSEYIKINYKTGELYDDRPGSLSAEGVKKIRIEDENPPCEVVLFGVAIGIEIEGGKADPQVKLFDPHTEETYAVFRYWGNNELHLVWEAEDGREEHLQIVGEFTKR